MRKTIEVTLAVLFVVIILLFTLVVSVNAQGIGVPIGPPPIGTPLPIAPGAYAPTWTAPWPPAAPQPTPQPTVSPYFTVTLLDPETVYACPSLACYNLTTLRRGTQVLVRWASPGWLQIESGYAWGSFLRDSVSIQH